MPKSDVVNQNNVDLTSPKSFTVLNSVRMSQMKSEAEFIMQRWHVLNSKILDAKKFLDKNCEKIKIQENIKIEELVKFFERKYS